VFDAIENYRKVTTGALHIVHNLITVQLLLFDDDDDDEDDDAYNNIE